MIYLDHHAHAPLDPRVASLLADAFVRFDANPHSNHGPGEAAHWAVEQARMHVASLIGADPGEVVFTSGATEANNIVIRGWGPANRRPGGDRVLVGAGEHSSVLGPADDRCGATAPRIALDCDGRVDLEALKGLLADGAGLVSVAAANHEIGTIQPVANVADLAHGEGALMHSDLSQAAGRIRFDLRPVDFGSLSSHKLGGPIGVGAVFVRRRLRRHLRPLLHGGGQEGGLRPGTVAAPLCVGFGEACRLAAADLDAELARTVALRDDLLSRLATAGGLEVNGGGDKLPGNLNVSFGGVDGEALVMRLRDRVACSTGSACTSASLEPSHVLAAIGLPAARAEGAVRFGLGRSTTATDVALAAEAVVDAVKALRAMATRRVA